MDFRMTPGFHLEQLVPFPEMGEDWAKTERSQNDRLKCIKVYQGRGDFESFSSYGDGDFKVSHLNISLPRAHEQNCEDFNLVTPGSSSLALSSAVLCNTLRLSWALVFS